MDPMPATDKSRTPDSEPLATRAVRGGLWVALSSYFNVAFGFAANLVLTRLLAPEHFGVFALAGFFFSLVNIRPKLGLGQAFAQQRDTTGEMVGTHLALDVASGLASLVVAGVAVPVLHALGYSWDVAWVVLALAAVGVVESFLGTAWVLLDKELHFGRTSLVSSVVFPLSYVPGFWLAMHGGGYWSLLAQSGAYTALLVAAMWWAARRRLPQVWRLHWRFDRQVGLGFVRFGGLVGLAGLAGMFVGQFDNFLVGTFVGVATLGYYDRAYRVAQWPSLLVSSVATRAAFYTYARLQDDPVRLRKTVTMTLWLISTLALPLALAIFASAPDLVSLLYTGRWLPSAPFVRFLVVYSLLRPVLDIASSLFVAVGKPQRATVMAAGQALVLAVAATPLTLAYGAVGTCIGVGVAFCAGLVLAYRYLRETVDLGLWSALAAPATSAALALAAYLLLARAVDLNALPLAIGVATKATAVIVAFFAFMVALQPRQLAERLGYVRGLLLPGRSAVA